MSTPPNAVPPTAALVRTKHCQTTREFLAALSPRGRQFPSMQPGEWIYRGHQDDTYELIPSALRIASKEFESLTYHSPKTNEEQLFAERELLENFLKVSDSIGLHLPEDTQKLRQILQQTDYSEAWPPAEVLSLMALAQHVGVPTRLLDWTRHPLKAALFAARSATYSPTQSGLLSVWAFSVGVFGMLHAETPFTVVTAPAATNSNLRAQEGLFTLAKHIKRDQSPVDRRPFDELLRAFSEEIGLKVVGAARYWFHRITLPQQLSHQLLYDLALEGITEATLYPDFYGVVRAMKDAVRWNKCGPGKERIEGYVKDLSISHNTTIDRTELMLRFRPPPPAPQTALSTLDLKLAAEYFVKAPGLEGTTMRF